MELKTKIGEGNLMMHIIDKTDRDGRRPRVRSVKNPDLLALSIECNRKITTNSFP